MTKEYTVNVQYSRDRFLRDSKADDHIETTAGKRASGPGALGWGGRELTFTTKTLTAAQAIHQRLKQFHKFPIKVYAITEIAEDAGGMLHFRKLTKRGWRAA